MEKTRLAFIDLLRGWAILVMIETHVFNAMLLPRLREASWFDGLNFINGLVAPSFLFVSGFVFILSSRRKLDDLRTFGSAFWKQIGRMLLIWIIAYGLHLPYFSFRKMFSETTPEVWMKFYQADVLHCIVVGWFFLLLSLLIMKWTSVFRRWLFFSGLLVVLLTPFVWDIDFLPFIPPPVAAYLNAQHYSLFPLFPWMGFVLMGSLVASLYVEALAEGRQKEFIVRLTWLGGVLCILSSLLAFVPMRMEYISTDWRANPLFFSLRLGIVFLLLAACWYYVDRRGTEHSFVLDVSRESLLVYVVHLLLIYGKYLGDKNLVDIYGKSFSTLECMAGSLGLAALMVATAKLWGWLKRRSLTTSRAVSFAVAMVTVVIFFIRKH